MENSVNIFRQNKNTINFASSIQNKQMTTKQYFKSRTVKYLGDGEIRTSEQVKGKWIGSLINMVSKNKSQLPFLFIGGGINKLAQKRCVEMSDANKNYIAPLPDFSKIISKVTIETNKLRKPDVTIHYCEDIESWRNIGSIENPSEGPKNLALAKALVLHLYPKATFKLIPNYTFNGQCE